MQFLIQTDNGDLFIEAEDFQLDEDNTLTLVNTSEGWTRDIWPPNAYKAAGLNHEGTLVPLQLIKKEN